MFPGLKKYPDTGEPEQFLRAHYRVFQPGFRFFKVFVGFRFKVNLLGSEISGSFRVIEIVTDLLGSKQSPDFTDEGINGLIKSAASFPEQPFQSKI